MDPTDGSEYYPSSRMGKSRRMSTSEFERHEKDRLLQDIKKYKKKRKKLRNKILEAEEELLKLI